MILGLTVAGPVVLGVANGAAYGLMAIGLVLIYKSTKVFNFAAGEFATIGAFQSANERGQQVVGVSNSTDYLRPHRTGRLRVIGVPIHQGRSYQLWQVEIRRPHDDKLIARGQVRLQHVDPKS